MNLRKLTGAMITGFALIFAIKQTNHFGNNLLPASAMEVMCDIASLIMLVFGYYLLGTKNHQTTTS